MNFLRIEQTYGQIGVETYKSQLQIKSQQSKLQMQQTHAKIEINKEEPRVIIDQHPCFATAGLKNDFELAQEAAQLAYQRVMEYIAKYAADGDMLARIKDKSNPIAEIARRDSFTQHEFNIDLIPKARPIIDFEGHISLSAREGQIQKSVQEGSLQVNFSKGEVRLFVARQPSLRIEYAGKNFDTYV